MKQETLEVHGYEKLDAVLRRIEPRLRANIRPALGYPTEALAARIAQKITMHITVPFLREGIRRYVADWPSFPSDDAAFTFDGITVAVGSGHVTPTAARVLRNSAEFLMLWLFYLGAWMLALVRGKRLAPCALVYGVPIADLSHGGNDGRFIDFCRRGPLVALREAKRLVVQAAGEVRETRPREACYVRLPLFATLSAQRLTLRQSGCFLLRHVSAVFYFFAGVVRNPIRCVLWRDVAEHAAGTALNDAGLIESIVITNTNWQQQFLWMNALENRRFSTYMALYSLNNHPIVYRSDRVTTNHPGISRLNVDEVWVWNDAYGALLKAEGVRARSMTVGPILWHLPERERADLRKEVPTICVFDVTPRTADSARALGAFKSYYNSDTAVRFIDDIVRAREIARERTGVELHIVLKHKRPRIAVDDARYFDHIDALRARAGSFEIVETDVSIYTLIAGSRAVIVPPYSSPAYVAAHMSVPALFYDATGEVIPTHAPHPLVGFLGDRDELALALAALVDQPAAAGATVERVIR